MENPTQTGLGKIKNVIVPATKQQSMPKQAALPSSTVCFKAEMSLNPCLGSPFPVVSLSPASTDGFY